ncbi:MAG TPA: glycosyltransferase, partial [Ignavibacteriaceae bacterium]|nr:glycosyltransferase [Ignavibacteriaceae bacterium]
NEIPDNNLIIGHIGNVNTENFYLVELLNSFMKVKQNNLKLLFVGNLKNETKEIIIRYSNDNIIIKDFIPHKELEAIYNRIDIGLILYKPHKLNEEYCAPNKLYEYFSHGIPVIAPKIAGLEAIFTKKILGHLLDFKDSAQLQNSLDNIACRLNNAKQEIIQLFKNEYDINIYLKKLNQILSKLELEKLK